MVPQQYPALHGFKFFLLIFLCLHHIAYGYLMINHHSSVFDIAGFDTQILYDETFKVLVSSKNKWSKNNVYTIKK